MHNTDECKLAESLRYNLAKPGLSQTKGGVPHALVFPFKYIFLSSCQQKFSEVDMFDYTTPFASKNMSHWFNNERLQFCGTLHENAPDVFKLGGIDI